MINKEIILSAFDQARQLGVATFEFGNKLADEIIYNFILQKVNLVIDTTHPITAYTTMRYKDLRIVVNPEYLANILAEMIGAEPTEQQLVTFFRGILKHELLHIALNHLIRDETRNNPKLSNIVMDSLINREIPEFGESIKFAQNYSEEALMG